MADTNERDADLNAEDPFESTTAQPNANMAEDDPIETPAETPESAAPEVVGEDAISETDEERAARESEEELLWIFQASVFDNAGQKIGRVGQVYLDDQTQKPNWVTVKTGLFGMKEFFIPLDGAERNDRRITVPYDKATVLSAPRTEIDQNLSPSEEDALYNHYQVEGKTTEVVSLEGEAPVTAPGIDLSEETEIAIDGTVAPEGVVAEPVQSSANEFDSLINDEPAVADEVFANPELSEEQIGEPPVELPADESENPFENPEQRN